jgi:hypothetical protein
MKKFALLMGSLVVAATASAKELAPAPVAVKEEPVVVIKEVEKKNTGLRATSISQTLGYEDWESNPHSLYYLATQVNLAYGPNSEWTGYVEARKGWRYYSSSDKSYARQFRSYAGESRVQLSAKRNFKFSEGSFSVGPRWRGYGDHDRFYLDMSYAYAPAYLADYGIALSGFINPEYRFRGDEARASDNRYGFEMMPMTVGFKQFRIGYYLEAYWGAKGGVENDYKSVNQQIRMYFPIWKNDKWAFNFENRLFINKLVHEKDKAKYGIDNRTDKNWQANRAILKANYKATDKLTLSALYAYQYGKYEKADQTKDSGIRNEVTVGFSYKL